MTEDLGVVCLNRIGHRFGEILGPVTELLLIELGENGRLQGRVAQPEVGQVDLVHLVTLQPKEGVVEDRRGSGAFTGLVGERRGSAYGRRMKTLNFRKAWIDPILTGAKTTTIRVRTTVKPGEVAAARCRRDRPPFALLQVTGVREVKLAALNPAVAAEERIERIYPDAEDLVEISFTTVGGP